MSKNKNYGNYYKKPQVEEPINETPVEEVQATEETAAAPIEKASVEEEKVEEVSEPKIKYAIVAGAKKVNMRENASTEAKVLIVLGMGTKVEFLESIYGSGKAWAKIRYNDREGYMMEQYLKHVAN